MNKIIACLSIVAVSFLLTACPYESTVPIDNPTIKYPASLLGKWEPKNSSDDLFVISRKDAYIFVVTKTKKESTTDEKPEVYEAYLSNVGGATFLNLQEIQAEDGTKKFNLYKMQINQAGTRITLSEISENIDEKFESSAALKSFIEKNMGHSFFYTKEDEVYIKVE